MKNKKNISIFFITFLLTIISFLGTMFIFDPLQLFHKHWNNDNKLVPYMRQQAAGIINQYEFDSIILGSSIFENTSAREASKILGGKFVNLSLEGSTFATCSLILKYALEKKTIKQVLYSLDISALILPIHRDTSDFDYLYDNNKFNDLLAYQNSKYLYCLLNDDLCFGNNIDLNRANSNYRAKENSDRFGGLEYFFKAIKELNSKHPEIISDFEFIFAGALDRKNKALFEEKIPSVKHIGLLSFNKALELQKKADILLVIDTPFKNPNDAIFFPSKLLDYMLIQRRIVALTDKNSTTWDVVHKKLGDCFEHTDIENIIQFLIQAWKLWKNKDREYFYHQELDIDFSAEKKSEQLSSLFYKFYKKEQQHVN